MSFEIADAAINALAWGLAMPLILLIDVMLMTLMFLGIPMLIDWLIRRFNAIRHDRAVAVSRRLRGGTRGERI